MRTPLSALITAILTFTLSAVTALAQTASPVATPAATPTETVASFALPGDQVFPEGIAYRDDIPGLENTAFVGSTTDGTIYKIDLASGNVDTFSPGGADGRTSALGMHIGDQGQLAVAGGMTGRAWVYDVASGALLSAYSTQAEGSFLNDLAITPSGDIYITDSSRPILWRIDGTADDGTPVAASSPITSASPAAGATPVGGSAMPLEPWIDLTTTPITYGEGFNLNGIVTDDSGTDLVAVQTNTGNLYRVDVASKSVTSVDLQGESVMGGDGLVLSQNRLYAVHNGTISAIDMSDDLNVGSIVGDFTDPALSSPTTAAKIGSCLLVVNSQFANQGGTPTLPFTISAIAIPRELLLGNAAMSPAAIPGC